MINFLSKIGNEICIKILHSILAVVLNLELGDFGEIVGNALKKLLKRPFVDIFKSCLLLIEFELFNFEILTF